MAKRPPDDDDAAPAVRVPFAGQTAVTPFEARRAARSLYWRGWTLTQVAAELALNYNTVASWCRRESWDKASAVTKIEDALDARLSMLIAKDAKTGHDFKEIDLLGRQFERLARIRRYSAADGHEGDLNPNIDARNSDEVKAKKRDTKAKKNRIDAEMAAKLRAAFEESLFPHQREDWLSSTSLRTRFILKSRQIGATWYFARERLIRALETGNNQIFISASKAQAHIFRHYIVEFVHEVTGITLTGDPIVIDRGPDSSGEDENGEPMERPCLYFLGTNYRTAQGYHGDVIVDEAFWIHGFEQLFKVAGAMATQKRYTRTLFSTPSMVTHQAYPMWSGERFNKRRAKGDRVEIRTDEASLRRGAMGPDGIWRHIVTLEDAMARGFDLIDLDEIRLDTSPDEFDLLYRCIFADDTQSTFPFEIMRRCMVDSWEVWKGDYEPYALRPYAGKVWLGHDPNASPTGDECAIAVLAAPTKPGGKFRVLEKLRLRGLDFAGQAAEIQRLCGKYDVEKIAIDTTGAGTAVHQIVVKFLPSAVALNYSLISKAAMVIKAKNVVMAGRMEFDAGWKDVLAAFMAIHPEITKGGGAITYRSGRGGTVGHADIAWAIINALFLEPLDGLAAGQSTMEIF